MERKMIDEAHSVNMGVLVSAYCKAIKKIHELEKRNKYLCAQLRFAKANERRMAGALDAKNESGDNDGQ